MMPSRRVSHLCLALVLVSGFLQICVESKGSSGGGGSGGGSRGSFSSSSRSSFSSSRSSFSSSTTRSSVPTTFRGYSVGRSGFSPSPILIGFAAGAMTSAAQHQLIGSSKAYCNGLDVQCYKTACQNALKQCPSTNSTSKLNPMTCPDSKFTECYQRDDTNFQCLGTKRPEFNDKDVQGFCYSSSSTGLKLHLVLLGALALLAIVVL